MEFIELTGRQLWRVISHDEVDPNELRAAGVTDDSVVRINRQGDIELRLKSGWEIIGGLLGDYEHRVMHETKLDWA